MDANWIAKRTEYQKLAEAVEPAAVIKTKDHWFWSAIWWLLCIVTCGLYALGLSKEDFLQNYATTIGPIHGYPARWVYLPKATVLHEARHTTQATWFGWVFFPIAWISRRLRAWLGLPLNMVVYALLPLPIGLAAGRFYLELDADRKSWEESLRRGILAPRRIRDRASYKARHMSSGSYFWAWPYRWALPAYKKMAEEVIREYELAATCKCKIHTN